ncbi:Uncharacterised protein [Flavobacterium hibernum]|nr:Uncharacterised protein [Flavobacterium hibernum]
MGVKNIFILVFYFEEKQAKKKYLIPILIELKVFF